MKTFKHTFLIVITITIFSASTKSQINNFDYGKVENGVYSNSYFGVKMTLPTNWIVQSKEQTECLVKASTDIVAGDDENLQVILDASKVNTANLLIAFEYELGSAVEYNPSIVIVAENVEKVPGIKIGSDYLFHARRLMLQTQIKYEDISENFKHEEFDEIEFYKMATQINYMELEIKQDYYSTVMNGFSFNVIISYVTEKQKKVLLKSLKSMLFAK